MVSFQANRSLWESILYVNFKVVTIVEKDIVKTLGFNILRKKKCREIFFWSFDFKSFTRGKRMSIQGDDVENNSFEILALRGKMLGNKENNYDPENPTISNKEMVILKSKWWN